MNDKQLSMFPGAAGKAPAASKGSSFTLSRTVRGKAQKVFDQWLIPVFIGEWMLGGHVGDDEIVDLSNTVRQGGAFCFTSKRQGRRVRHQGSYRELKIPQLLAFNWCVSTDRGAESQVRIEFTEQEAKTRLKISVRLPAALSEQKDSLKQQWAARIDALAARMSSH